MTVTISRLYDNYEDAKTAVADLEAAGVAHNDVSIIASKFPRAEHGRAGLQLYLSSGPQRPQHRCRARSQ
jgi:hypothetical protein